MRFLAFLLALPLLANDVTLNGTAYTLKAHPRVFLDGPSGTLSVALQTSPRNTSSNQAWAAIKAATDNIIADVTTYPNIPGAMNEGLRGTGNLVTADRYGQCSNAALLWWAAGGGTQSPIDPSGFLALAKYCLTHIEDYYVGSFGCNTAVQSCGRALSEDGDYAGMRMHNIAITYTIVRSLGIDTTNGLTQAQVTAFLNKMLNDRSVALNGIDSADCQTDGRGVQAMDVQGAVTATVSANSTSVTFSSSRTFADKGIILPYPSDVYSTVIGVFSGAVSGTTGTLNAPAKYAHSSTFYYSPPLSGNPCGIIWVQRHSNTSPAMGSNPANYQTDYSSTAGITGGASNLAFATLEGYIALGLALADDDARAETLLTQAYNYYFQNYTYGFALSAYNGLNTSGPGYLMDRQAFVIAAIAVMLKNSIDGTPPPAAGQNLIRNQAKGFYFWHRPWDTAAGYFTMPWASSADSDQGYARAVANRGATATYQWLLANSQTTEAAYVQYYLLSIRTDFASLVQNLASYATFPFMLWDPAATSTNFNALPSQFHFAAVDSAYCGTLPGTPYCDTTIGWDHTVSKSGWASTDTMVTTHGGHLFSIDHSDQLVGGAYHIGRKANLLVGDSSFGIAGMPFGTFGAQNDNLITVGSDANYSTVLSASAPFFSAEATSVPLLRWAGSTSAGDSGSRYAYAAYNLATAYKAGANITAAIREVAHLKKASNQDFVVSHERVAVSSGTTIYAAWHYPRNGAACSTVMTDYDAPNREAEGTQSTLSKLVSKWLPLTANSLAMLRDNADYSYTGGNGYTCRVRTCASADGSTCNSSATSFEEIVIHMPVDGVSGSMPTVTQPTDTNFWVTQIASSYPKVIAFGKAGTTYTSAAFTSTHSATAQYLISGLTAGTYDVTVVGSPVTGSPFTVAANDNTIYFESTAGAVVVGAGSPPAVPSTAYGGKLVRK